MNATKAKELARWDQCEANFREALAEYTSPQLQVLAIDLIERPERVAVQGMSALAAIAVMYELQRRNGGFGRETFNPCAKMTP